MDKNEKTSKSDWARQEENNTTEQQKLTLQQAIDLAMQHHTAGELPKAEIFYQKILQNNPNQPDALHLLGVISHQRRKNDTAVDLITQALQIRPNYAEANYNLGLALQNLGKRDEAIKRCRKAVTIKPNYVETHNNIGNILKEF